MDLINQINVGIPLSAKKTAQILYHLRNILNNPE